MPVEAQARDLAARRLAELEMRVALTERVTGMGMWRWGWDDEYPTWSPGLYRILGIDPSSPPSRSAFWKKTVPEDALAIANAIRSVREAPGPFYYVQRIRRADGLLRHVESFGDVEMDQDGNPVAIVAICADITRRIEVEDQLKSAIESFRALTEDANDVICRHATDGTLIYVSPAMERVLGYEPGELLGKSAAVYCAPEELPEMRKVLRDLNQPGVSRNVTYRVRHKDGRILWFETACRSIGHPATHQVEEIISVSRDVTIRREAELEVERAREAAESANRTKSRFLANMSHELRTPLNAILGFSDMMKSEMLGPLPKRYLEYAALINESGSLLLDLINDILDMSKIEAGKYELSLTPFDPAEAADTCLRMIRDKAEAAGIAIHVETAQGLTVEADRRAFKQILINLLSNAVKFTPPGGHVDLAMSERGGLFLLTVSDTGIGIPQSALPRLGKPFEQVTLEERLAKPGTGLGLALVRSLAELHGGEMRIASIEGSGTTVSVSLPVSAPAARAA
jgi:PAS domain S-box-containing protein